MNRRERLRSVFGTDPDAVERLARALDTPQPGPTSDPTVNGMVAAARALAPALYPREEWRSTLKERMLREAVSPATVEDGAGSRDGIQERTYTVEVIDPGLGRLVLADLESIDESRAHEVASAAARVVRTHRLT